MISRLIVKICTCLTIVALIQGCSKANYIPYLTAEWKNAASSVVDNFYFNVVHGGAYASDFWGNESVNYSYVYKFSGSYENHKIHFTFSEGPNSGSTYSGHIDGEGKSAVITLNTPSGELILTQ